MIFDLLIESRDFICAKQVGYRKTRQRKYSQFMRAGKKQGHFRKAKSEEIRKASKIQINISNMCTEEF